jgi:multiple sugar transport system substrate-binding protein
MMIDKKKISRRHFLRMAALGTATTALAACLPGATPEGGQEAPAPAGDETVSDAASSPTNGVVEVDFVTFYTGPDGAIMQGIIDQFNDEHEGIKVNFSAPAWGAEYVTRIQTAGLAGNPPGVVALHNYEIPPLAQYLYDINEAVETMGVNKDDFVNIAWELPMYEGKLLGATMSTGTVALYYNKDLFEQAGLDPEKPPTNTAEFIEAGKAIRALGDDTWGFVRDNGGWLPWYSMNWQNGGDLLTEDGTGVLFNSQAGIEAAQLEQSFVKEHGFNPPEPAADRWALMDAGKLGMLFDGPWQLSRMFQSNAEAGTNFATAPYVTFFDDAPGIQSTSHIYCVTRQEPEDPAQREAGLTLISWLLKNGSLEWAKAQAPTNRSVLEQMQNSPDELVRAMVLWVEQAPQAKFPPYHPQWGQISTMLREGVELIVYQGDDPTATLAMVVEQSNGLL